MTHPSPALNPQKMPLLATKKAAVPSDPFPKPIHLFPFFLPARFSIATNTGGCFF